MKKSYVFKEASIIDGSGRPAFVGDVEVRDGIIADVCSNIGSSEKTIIDCDGLVLAPGFIDMHTHTDGSVFKNPNVESKLYQGVTLDVIGNCGLGMFPVNRDRKDQLLDFLKIHDFTLPESGIAWNDLTTYSNVLDNMGLGLNVAPLVGHAPLRLAVMGNENREPTPKELQQMQDQLLQLLEQGAWGMSTGLIYPPGSYSKTDELIELAKVLEKHDSMYSSHIRNEGSLLMSALEEAIQIGRESGAKVQVSHLKSMGKENWGQARKALDVLENARREGVNIWADQYPYGASSTYLSAVIPQWAHAGGVPALLGRLKDPSLRYRLESEIRDEIEARGGPDGVMVTNVFTKKNGLLSGATILQISQQWKCKPEEAAVRLIVEEEAAVGANFFSMSEGDIRTILASPEVAVGSDGRGLNMFKDAASATHPRSYGTFTRVLGHYVRDEKVLSLETAVHKMTGLSASRMGFVDRGIIKAGNIADIVVFDANSIKETSSYANAHNYSEGVIHLLVNGEMVISDGLLTGRRPGRVVKKTASKNCNQ